MSSYSEWTKVDRTYRFPQFLVFKVLSFELFDLLLVHGVQFIVVILQLSYLDRRLAKKTWLADAG